MSAKPKTSCNAPRCIYNPETVKKAVRLSQFFRDEGIPVKGNRAVATWRGGEHESVSIDDEKGVWNDHKAGEGGDVITAYAKIHDVSPLAAIRALGERYQVAPTKVVQKTKKLSRAEMLLAEGYNRAATYTYTDESGAYLYSVDRYEWPIKDGKHDKQFVQRHGDVENIKGIRRVLYNLPQVLNAASVYIVEGEKDVETLRKLGIVATTNSGGAKFWQEDFNAAFTGKAVIIIADNDAPGLEHAEKIARQLVGVAKSVKVLTISKLPKGDVTDWIEREGGTAEKLEKLVADAPEYSRQQAEADERPLERFTLADVPEYVPEDQDPNILIKGRLLEIGGSLFWISTAGTGKTIVCMQLSMLFTEGLPFAGIIPVRPLRIWIFQTEDSMSRLAIDRADITAELSEQMPVVDWKKTWNKITFFKILGKVGAQFLADIDERLTNEPPETKPDVIVLNPLMSFIGGQISDGTFVTPFLRGGEINHQETPGLQYILEKHKVGVIVFHHTPKPPSPNEIKSWLRSPFPEYQGGGAADITNWGRSFISMMKIPDKPNVVCLTAGKNGAELGWDMIDGAYRRYMAWSNQTGITGKNRHAWREVEPSELSELTKDARAKLEADAALLAKMLSDTPMTWTQAKENKPKEMTHNRFNAAWKEVTENAARYGLASAEVPTTATKKPVYWGLPDAARSAADTAFRNWKSATE